MIATSVVTTHLKKLGELYFKQDDTNRATTFNSAATAILEKYPEFLPEDLKQLGQIHGIGPSTINECIAAVTSGTSERLLRLEKTAPLKDSVAESLDKIRSLLRANKQK